MFTGPGGFSQAGSIVRLKFNNFMQVFISLVILWILGLLECDAFVP